jgi:DNA-binding transcriptional LysR family regulator
MRASAASVLTTAEQLARDDDGVIRFAGNAEAMQRFGVKLVSKFKEKNPQISFDLLIDVAWDKNQSLLDVGKADLVLRPIDEISGDKFIAKKNGAISFGCLLQQGISTKVRSTAITERGQRSKIRDLFRRCRPRHESSRLAQPSTRR